MKDKKGLLVGGCGLILSGLCFISFCFWTFLVIQDSGGIDAEEAFPGAVSSCCCLLMSVGIMGVGVIMAVKAKKQNDPSS